MKSSWKYLPILIVTLLFSCGGKKTAVRSYSPTDQVCSISPSALSGGNYYAPKSSDKIALDGKGEDSIWEKAPWREIKYRWSGSDYTPQDFQGRYKIVWDKNNLYFLVEVIDNILSDQHRDPIEKYWHDDGIKISVRNPQIDTGQINQEPVASFVLAINGDVIELAPNNKSAKLITEGLKFKRSNTKGNLHTWEVIYPIKNRKQPLMEGDFLGYSISYYDNDGKGDSENTIGSIAKREPSTAKDTNEPILGKLELIE